MAPRSLEEIDQLEARLVAALDELKTARAEFS
jgi:hypothetical protein